MDSLILDALHKWGVDIMSEAMRIAQRFCIIRDGAVFCTRTILHNMQSRLIHC
jgi:ABC-type sugar transport system ATPase subunit